MLNLIEIFNVLQSPPLSNDQNIRFAAQPIPDYPKHRIAKDSQGRPALLISVSNILGNDSPAPIKLEHVSIQYNAECHISQSSGFIEDGQFTIIGCIVNDETLHNYFLHTATIIITTLGETPSQQNVIETINYLVELFRAITESPRKSVQGLWAELFLIAQATDISTMIEAWHITPEDRYDFSWNSQRIEVKSTSQRMRQHHFSLEQLSPSTNTDLIIASMFVEYAGAGTSIMDLVEQIRQQISTNTNLLLKVDRVISSTLGNSWRDAFYAQFDIELATDSLMFFDALKIPSINRDLPSGVSEIHFKSDLANCQPVNPQHFRTMGGVFQAVLRRKTANSKHTQ